MAWWNDPDEYRKMHDAWEKWVGTLSESYPTVPFHVFAQAVECGNLELPEPQPYQDAIKHPEWLDDRMCCGDAVRHQMDEYLGFIEEHLAKAAMRNDRG